MSDKNKILKENRLSNIKYARLAKYDFFSVCVCVIDRVCVLRADERRTKCNVRIFFKRNSEETKHTKTRKLNMENN